MCCIKTTPKKRLDRTKYWCYNACVPCDEIINKMIDVRLLDPRFVADIVYLFEKGENIGRIAYLMDTDMETVDQILCDSIAKDMVEDEMMEKYFE